MADRQSGITSRPFSWEIIGDNHKDRNVIVVMVVRVVVESHLAKYDHQIDKLRRD